MANSLYITATEARSGKSAISLGLMEMLLRQIEKVGFFRPIITVEQERNEKDNDIDLISSYFDLGISYEKMYGYTAAEAGKLLSARGEGEVLEGIMRKYDQLEEVCEFVLCEGTDFASSTAAFELDINADISKNLGSPVLLVANAHKRTVDQTARSIELALDSLNVKGSHTIATIINRIVPRDAKKAIKALKMKDSIRNQLVYTIPENESLGRPTVGEIAQIIGAEVLYGKEQLNRHVHNFSVAAMQLHNFLTRIERGSLIITPGDRADIIVACLAIVLSTSMENISGILLTGGLKPQKAIWSLIKGFPQMVPILSVKENTFPTATMVNKIHATISPDNDRKITQAIAVFEKNVDVEELGEKIIATRTSIVTPKMFEYELLQRAKANKQHIVLPEGEEERILKAAEILLRREVVDITLLGNEELIRDKIVQLGLRINAVNIIDPVTSKVFDDYAQTYYELRKHKGITMDNAGDVMSDVLFFGTMMVYKGHADGMVSGAVHSTAATVRPAFEFIKTKAGFSIVSSVFFMCLPDRVLVYGDCAVNPNPSAKELAEIALSSSQTAKTFGIDPVVAMLSYSTGESGKGEDVDRVREATKIAIDAGVAKTKMPKSEVAGKATVFIFPDLNTGNNTYKAVQLSAGAVAVGPVLQGLKYPVNDLSRGCTVPDIINTIAITAIQAQSEKGF
jgi:phosphate acetyltransferase